MHILSVLTALAAVELEMAGLYEWLSGVFAEDSEAAGFFFRMSLQERSHYNLVRFGKRLVHTSPNEFADVEVDGAEIQRLRDAIAEFRASSPHPSLREALEFAITVEHHAGENIHRAVIIDSNPAVAGVVRNLATSDADHLRSLVAFARERFPEESGD
jgi:hypothetical protein